MTDCAGVWHPELRGRIAPAGSRVGLTGYAFGSSKPPPEVTAVQESGDGPLVTTPAA